MDKLDRLGWAAGLNVDAHGIAIGVRTTSNDPTVLREVQTLLPPGATPRNDPRVDVLYSLVQGKIVGHGHRNYHLLYMNATRVARTMEWDEVRERLQLGTRVVVAQSVLQHVFVAAAVVGCADQAVLIVGLGQVNRLALVGALIRSGCTYLSSEYALISAPGGEVTPFPNLVPVRQASDTAGMYYSAEELGWPVERRSLPIGLVVLARHRPTSQWRQTSTSKGRALLALMGAAIAARREPALTLRIVDLALAHAGVIEVRFGDAEDGAERLLHAMRSHPR